ncbi:MAG: hypothetical protein NMNS01_23370 [Nitrosomonas sp.]|nr:MAG: hypothetical protein NMNS01_23370 [Nitrosomonas sp.]
MTYPYKNAKDVDVAIAAAALPATGMARWNRIAPHIPVSKEKFRQLYKEGRAPQPQRMGLRCTFFDLVEVHRFIANPITYRVPEADK